jgi:Fe-S cluster assembly protein SufD
MSAVGTTHPYVERLLTGSRDLPATPLSWLNARRSSALERANALSVPTVRDEEWRFTDITPLTKLPVRQPAPPVAGPLPDIEPFLVKEARFRLVFLDGVFSPQLSATDDLPEGVVVTPLAAGLEQHALVMEPNLAQHADFSADLFSALNTAHLRDGALVRIARNHSCESPIHLLFVSTQKETAVHPRVLVLLETGAGGTVVEDYVGICDGAYFANAVAEIVLAPGARLRHVRLQREAADGFHIANAAVVLDKDAEYVSNSVALGARLSRYNLTVTERGEGASCHIDGLALIGGRQLADTHTAIDHACPNGRSAQMHKTIVADAAHAVFNGKIIVREGAQLTDSAQQSRNLLLSPRARVDTKPQLEIFADDVKCAHGATVGQLDAEHVFYLKSRGVPEEQARNLLTYAFGAEVIDRIPVPSLVDALEKAVLARTKAEL